MQQTIPQALLAYVDLSLGSFSTGEPCTCQEDFKKLKNLNQVVAIQQMWTLCHPSDQMEVAGNFDIHLIHATLFLFLVDGIYGTLLFFRALFAKILLRRPITIRLYANLHLKFVLERASNIMILTIQLCL